MNEVAISFGSMGSLGATGILTIGLPFSASQSSPIQAGLDIPSVIICSKLSTNCGCLLWPLQIWVDPYSPGHRKNQCCVKLRSLQVHRRFSRMQPNLLTETKTGCGFLSE